MAYGAAEWLRLGDRVLSARRRALPVPGSAVRCSIPACCVRNDSVYRGTLTRFTALGPGIWANAFCPLKAQWYESYMMGHVCVFGAFSIHRMWVLKTLQPRLTIHTKRHWAAMTMLWICCWIWICWHNALKHCVKAQTHCYKWKVTYWLTLQFQQAPTSNYPMDEYFALTSQSLSPRRWLFSSLRSEHCMTEQLSFVARIVDGC